MKWIKNNKNDDSSALKPGMVFEKYTVVKQLGQGGMGSVYLVRHNVLDSLFALKILASDVASKNKQFVDRFIREAKLACKIRHPNLIAVHDAGQNPKNGQYYIVMDYVSGGSVRDLLKKTQRIPPDQALRIITQVADALTAACAHHMVHRDIKPDNIMFAADGSVKLADLGIAKSTDEQDTMITMAASVFGTPAYMSPEQAKDSSKVDSRADIYSLGIVFFEMLSGQRPFTGNTAIQILSQVMDAASVPDIRQICPDAPPDLALLISRMSEKNLDKRIPNPDVLLQELKKIHIPPQLAGRPLRTREEVAAGAVPSAPDVTMPTMETVGDVPVAAPAASAPDVTMPTMETVGDVPVAAPAPPETTPAVAAVPPATTPAPPVASAPDVTMPTMETVGDVPVAAPAPPETTPSVAAVPPATTPAPPVASAPDVTMPTVGDVPTAAPAPPATAPVAPAPPVASATVPAAPETAPVPPAAPETVSAPDTSAARTVSAAEKSDSSPTASSQPKGKKGILPVVSIVAACLVVVLGVSLAAMFLFRQKPSPGPAPETDPVHANASDSGTSSGGTSITETPVIQPSQPDDRGPVKQPVRGSAADTSRDVEQSSPAIRIDSGAPAAGVQTTTGEMTSDPLGKNQIVLLADTSAVSKKAKAMLSQAFGPENVSFQEAEGMGSYKQMLKTIVKSEPSIVVICFAQQYAEDRISASGYENVIGYHADQFQENGIPCMFIQPPEEDDDARMRAFREATTDLCRQHSIPFLNAEDLTDEKFISIVRENKKAE